MVFHEAPHKLPSTLRDLEAAFGPERRITLCRELTKLHEQVWRTTLGQAADHYREEQPKGEFVLVIEGAPPLEKEEGTLEEGLILVAQRKRQGVSTRDAVKQAAAACGLSRKALYDLVVAQPDPPTEEEKTDPFFDKK